MIKTDTSKEQLIAELELLRRRIAELEERDAERRQVGEVIRKEKKLAEAYLNIAGVMLATVNADENITLINKKGYEILGYKEGELIDRNWFDALVPQRIRDEVRGVFHELMAGNIESVEYYENPLLTKDGEERLIAFHNTIIRDPNGQIVGVLFSAEDITERKQAEERIKHAAEEWRTTFDSITDLVSIPDKDFRLVRVNKAYADAFKMKPKELIGKTCYEIVHGTKQPCPDCPHKKTLETKGPATGEFFEPHLGVHLQVATSPIFNEKGGVVGSVHIARDITGRKRAEETLRKSERRYHLLAENMADVIWTVDMNMRLTYVSPSVTRLLGYSVEEAMTKMMEEVFTPASFEIAMKALAEELVIEDMEQKDLLRSRTLELELNCKDGSIVPVEVKYSFLRGPDGRPVEVLAIARDITKRKKMQQQLILTDRLASVGELASGIAHELNNPLTSVIGFSQLLLDKDVSDDVKLDLKIIYSEAQRAAEVVKGLLTFARKHVPVKQPVNIDSIIEKVLALRAYEQRVSNIQVNTHFAPDLLEVMADHFQLQQVFLNIIINAEYFMIEAHGEGTITITTEEVGDIVKASFTDDGPGINQENLGHLFDPFFTTKEVGKGTGLGLSICHGIITEHGGRIYAESELGKGATFAVELPISDYG